MRIPLCLLILTFSSFHQALGQPNQTIKGRIIDKNTLQALPGANVYILQDSTIAHGASSDLQGYFKLVNVPVGRHIIHCRFIGYDPWRSGNLELTSAKELVVDIELVEAVITAQEVVITAGRLGPEPINEFASLGARSFIVEETQRYAGSINDPGRMALSFPGVQFSQQDNENTIVVRGNSPYGILWRLEGADIVNPNHFADRASSGGGISALSIYALGTSDFMAGVMPNEYGNALAGAMDLNFRKGNREQREYRIQVGMIGLDFATEGPFSKKKSKSSYLLNYRYSTLGLLNEMGIRVVSPQVSNVFQDLSFNMAFQASDQDYFTVYGLGGISNEQREPVEDPTEWEYYRDLSEYNYDTRLGVIGLTYTHLTKASSYLHLTISGSANNITWDEDTINFQGQPSPIKNEHFRYSKYFMALTYSGKFSNTVHYKFGNNTNYQGYDVFSTSYDGFVDIYRNRVLGEGTTWQNQTYVQLGYRPSPLTIINGGITLSYYPFNDNISVEPRIELNQTFSGRHTFKIAAGLSSQQVPFTTSYTTSTDLLTGDFLGYPNIDLPIMKSIYLAAGLDFNLSEMLRLSFDPYYQKLNDVGASTNPSRTFWVLNAGDLFELDSLQDGGLGQNYGVDITLEKFFSNQVFFIANGSVFRSLFKPNNDGSAREFHTRYGNNFISSLTSGKEWLLQDGKSFELGFKVLYSTGLRYTPIDNEESEIFRQTIEIQDMAFTERTIDYFRIDLRFSYRKNLEKSSWKLSLDIQNATNRVNEERPYYDFLRKEVVFDPQASIIPVISYILDF